ncbi:hypothetical protein, partial [Mesorhizobium sp. M2A.F.Ca.ET.037.01.1.1]|uniref:hypothetical protein n=1 Tax=Mesorhizobium sp. M2A.F.Ca.ET.037.01.1.1 TaxID=2496748 RepID=UPI001AEC9305
RRCGRQGQGAAETRFGGALSLAAAAAGFVSEVLFGMSPPNPRIYFTLGEHMRWRYRSATARASHRMSRQFFMAVSVFRRNPFAAKPLPSDAC